MGLVGLSYLDEVERGARLEAGRNGCSSRLKCQSVPCSLSLDMVESKQKPARGQKVDWLLTTLALSIQSRPDQTRRLRVWPRWMDAVGNNKQQATRALLSTGSASPTLAALPGAVACWLAASPRHASHTITDQYSCITNHPSRAPTKTGQPEQFVSPSEMFILTRLHSPDL